MKNHGVVMLLALFGLLFSGADSGMALSSCPAITDCSSALVSGLEGMQICGVASVTQTCHAGVWTSFGPTACTCTIPCTCNDDCIPWSGAVNKCCFYLSSPLNDPTGPFCKADPPSAPGCHACSAGTTTTTTAATTTTTSPTTTTTTTTTTTSATSTTTVSPACGGVPTDICGVVKDAETGTVNLKNIAMELRNVQGRVTKTAFTDANGQYLFSNPGPGPWILSAALERTQVAIPNQKAASPGNAYDFALRGEAAIVRLMAEPSTFVLVTSVNYTNPDAPIINFNSSNPTSRVFARTIGLDGTVDLQIPYGTNGGQYYLTCWRPQICNGKIIYMRAPPNGSKALPPFTAQQSPSSTPPLAPISCDIAGVCS